MIETLDAHLLYDWIWGWFWWHWSGNKPVSTAHSQDSAWNLQNHFLFPPHHHPKLYFGEDQVQAELNLVRARKHLKSVPSSSESSWLRKLFYNPLGYWYNTFQGFVYIYKKLWCKIFTLLSVSVCIAYKYLYLKRLYLKSLMLYWEFTISGNLNCMASMNEEKPILV